VGYKFYVLDWAAIYGRKVVTWQETPGGSDLTYPFSFGRAKAVRLKIGSKDVLQYNDPGFVFNSPNRLFASNLTDDLELRSPKFDRAPLVVSSANGVVFAMQRITYGRFNLPWAGKFAYYAGHPNAPINDWYDYSSPNGHDLVSFFLFLRVNMKTGTGLCQRCTHYQDWDLSAEQFLGRIAAVLQCTAWRYVRGGTQTAYALAYGIVFPKSSSVSWHGTGSNLASPVCPS